MVWTRYCTRVPENGLRGVRGHGLCNEEPGPWRLSYIAQGLVGEQNCHSPHPVYWQWVSGGPFLAGQRGHLSSFSVRCFPEHLTPQPWVCSLGPHETPGNVLPSWDTAMPSPAFLLGSVPSVPGLSSLPAVAPLSPGALSFHMSPGAALQATGSWAVPPLAGPQGLLTGCSHTSTPAQEDPGFLLPRGFSSHIPPNTLDRPWVPVQD